MHVTSVVISLLLAAILVASAVGKLTGQELQLRTLRAVGFPPERVRLLAVAELAGAAGLVAGLWFWPLGALAALGVVAYFVGAVASHLRARHYDLAPSATLLVLAAATLTLTVVTHHP